MRFKSFYLYLAGSIIALLAFVYELVNYYRVLDAEEIILSALPMIILSYLAIKVYREQDDEELM